MGDSIPTTFTAAIPWLIRLAIICGAFFCIKMALDYFVFKEMPEPSRRYGYMVLALFFLVALMALMFGIAI